MSKLLALTEVDNFHNKQTRNILLSKEWRELPMLDNAAYLDGNISIFYIEGRV